MNQYVDKALQHLTGKSNIDYATLEELDRIASEHPYFSIAQVLLAKKLQAVQADAFIPQVQKTALYFTNPYWLHYQLMNALPAIDFTNEEEIKNTAVDVDKAADTPGLEVTESGRIRQTGDELDTAAIPPIPIEPAEEINTATESLLQEETKPLEENILPQTENEIEEPLSKPEDITTDGSQKVMALENDHIEEVSINFLEPAPSEDNQTSNPQDLASLDHPIIPENFKYHGEPSVLLEDTFTLRPEENEFLNTPSTGFDQLPGEEIPQQAQTSRLAIYVQEPEVSPERTPILPSFNYRGGWRFIS